MGDQQAQFEQMVTALASNDNTVRGPAEERYNETKKSQPAWLIQALVEVGCNSTNLVGAQMSLVLLRKNFTDLFEVMGSFTSEQQEHIKSSLLKRFGDSNTPHPVRKACASAIANLATKLSTANRNAWPDLWELLLSTAANEGADPRLRAMCLEVFSQVAVCLVTTYFRPQLPRFVATLGACLAHQQTGLRTKAIETVAEFVHVAEDEQMPELAKLGINVVNAYRTTVESGDCEEAVEQAKHLRGIVEESDVTFFEQVYPPLLEALYDAAATKSLDQDARHMAIGTLLSVGARTKALKKNQQYVSKLFNLLFEYMLNPEMDSDWATTYEKEEDEEKKTDFDAGAQGCDRLSHIVRGKVMEDLAAPCIMQNIRSDNWKNRGAALALLTYVFEGAMKSFLSHLDIIVTQVVIPHLEDPHPYVRYNAIQAVAQLSSDLCPGFEMKYCEAVLPIICQKLQDDCPRIMCLCACTLNTIFDELDNAKPPEEEDDNKVLAEDRRYKSSRFMDPFISPVCNALFQALKADKPIFVHSECLAALSALIQLSEARIRPFTDDIVQCCEHYLNYAGQGQDAMLIRCRAIECTTLTASYVKKESFGRHAHAVCTYLLNVLNSGLAQDDMRLRYILRGWTCMVECLGPEVLQYLGQVMDPLMSIANSKCDAERIEKDVGDEYKDTEQIKHVRICTPGKGETILRMHTGLIEDKDLALTIVLNFTEELKGHMYPYMRDLTQLAIDQLKFQAMSETRETAAELLRAVLVVVKEREPGNVDSFIRHVVPPLLAAIDDEAEADTVQIQLNALGSILKDAPVGLLPEELATDAARMMHEIYELSITNIAELQLKRQAEKDEDDIEDLENEEDEEADLLQDVATVIGQLLRIVPSFFGLFEERFLPMTTQLLNPQLGDTQHQIAVHLLCEFVENGGANVQKHLQNATQTFMRFAEHENPAVSQAAVYGLAVAIDVVGAMPRSEQVGSFVNTCFELSGRFLSNKRSREEEYFGVTCNFVSMGLRIVSHFGDVVDGKKLFQLMVDHMPTQDDEIETTRIHDVMAKWAMDNNHPLLGTSSPYRGRVLTILRETRLISDEAQAAIRNLQ